MANIAQTVNVLQSMVLTEGARTVLTPTYHVFDMYKPHKDATLLPTLVEGRRIECSGRSLPKLSASASRDAQERLHLGVSNLDAAEAERRLELWGRCPDLLYGSTCRHCGCLVELRARIAGKACPAPAPRW